jgi:hypothetical protein
MIEGSDSRLIFRSRGEFELLLKYMKDYDVQIEITDMQAFYSAACSKFGGLSCGTYF